MAANIAKMSHNMANSIQLHGFSVYQPALGATLTFFPALGTPELDQLINAYLPGPASAKEKRAAISVDFFEHSRQTGETFKFYPVNTSAGITATSGSPASSGWDPASPADFDMSPALSDVTSWSFNSVPRQNLAQISQAQTTISRPKSRPSKKSTPAPVAATRAATDYCSLPGMKILTRDGRDVTNSASRGCKTKEQRDHAHLMRIIKACDSCRRKKVRCDPSHKKRAATSQSPADLKPTKKARKAPETPPLPQTSALEPSISSFEFDPVFDQFSIESTFPLPESWDQFVQYEQDLDLKTTDLDLFLGSADLFSPIDLSPAAFGSSTNSPSSSQPFTPAPLGPSPVNAALDFQLAQAQASDQNQQPTLPYMDAFQIGTDYVDFNLYSPQSNLIDEDPVQLKSNHISLSDGQDGRLVQTLPSPSPLPSILSSALSSVSHTGDPGLERNIAGSKQVDANVGEVDDTTLSDGVSPSLTGTFSSPRNPSQLPPLPPPLGSEVVSRLGVNGDDIIDSSEIYSSHAMVATTSSFARVYDGLLISAPRQEHVIDTTVIPSTISSSPGLRATEDGITSLELVVQSNHTDETQAPSSEHGAHIPWGAYANGDEIVENDSTASRSLHASFSLLLDNVIGGLANLSVAGIFSNINSLKLSMASVHFAGMIGFRSWSVGTESDSFGNMSMTEKALAFVFSTLLFVVVLTLQAGSAKMPEGLYGLVYGGALLMAQALWHRTPPRSSQPAPEDHSSTCPGRGVTPGGWLNGKIQKARSFLHEKINQSSRSIGYDRRLFSMWRV